MGHGRIQAAAWAEELDFEVAVVDGKLGGEVEYLFWVGCAGALEDRAKKTTKAIATLLHQAGVNFAILGPAETCTGDPARRIGNEFVYSMLAQQNIETLNEAGLGAAGKTIVASCPHCFNTIASEYPQLGGNYEVVHHTQLLAKLVEQGKITPVNAVEEKITYHDPCFLGRHNKVFTPPREIMQTVPGVRPRKCTGARTAASAAARAGPGCGSTSPQVLARHPRHPRARHAARPGRPGRARPGRPAHRLTRRDGPGGPGGNCPGVP